MTLNQSTLNKLLILTFVIIIFILSLYFSKFHDSFADSQDVWGQFGDFFGGVMNPIVGLLTLFIVAAAYLLQRKELSATKDALEMSASTSLIKAQIDILSTVIKNNTSFVTELENDLQRVANTPFNTGSGYQRTFTNNGDELLKVEDIQKYIKDKRALIIAVRKVINENMDELKKLKTQLYDLP